MKRVLFLAYVFPPIVSDAGRRPLKFAKYLSDFGWEPTVLTADDRTGDSTGAELVPEIPPNIRIVRAPMLNQRIARGCRLALGSAIGGRIGGAIARRLQNRYCVPDVYALWKPEATRAALRIFQETRFDAIYATGFPWTSLISGLEISRLTARPLIVDFRGLWTERDMVRQVVDHASAVVTTSISLVRRLSAAHPHIDESKFTAIHDGFDSSDMTSRRARQPGQPFRIVYTGAWQEDDSPAELYDSIEWLARAQPRVLDRVEVVTAGYTPGEARRRRLDSIVRELGVVSHDATAELLQSADMLFLPHTNPERQWSVPEKLFAYLASGAPVFALTYPDKEAGRIVREIGGGVAVAPEDPGTLYHALSQICGQKHFDVPPLNEQALARFERRRLTAQLAAVLDACSKSVERSHPEEQEFPSGGDFIRKHERLNSPVFSPK